MQDAIDKACAEDAGRSTVPYEAALLLLHAGRNFPGAVELLQKYLASGSQPEAAPAYKAHYLLGLILQKQGNTQAAAAEYRTALAMASQFADARAALQRIAQ